MRGTAHDVRDQASAAAEQARGAQNVAGACATAALGARPRGHGVFDERRAGRHGVFDGRRNRDTAVRTRRQAADAVRQGRDSAASFVTEQPLLCAAIGVAIGAALASLLPSTETEDQLMGEASDAVKGDGRPGRLGGARKREERGEQGRGPGADGREPKEEGLSPSAVAEAARNVGEGIREGAQGAVAERRAQRVGERIERADARAR